MHSTPPRYSKLPNRLSIQAYWQQLVTRLEHAGCECARQEATLILQHVTAQSATAFVTTLQRPVTPSEQEQAEGLLRRRLAREPLQQILGTAGFYGRVFHVDLHVLVPRTETELLVETAIGMAGALPRSERGLRLADVGTGSGCIAVTLACELPDARVVALDVSRKALEIARRNIAVHNVGDRVQPVQSDLLTAVGGRLSALVANLPYVRTAELSTLQPEVSRFEPRRALDGGADGLDAIRRLILQAPGALLPGGALLLEVGHGQAGDVLSLLDAQHVWGSMQVLEDLQGIPRVIVARLTAPRNG
jgi:release factor glutamine methyltransferase